VFSLAELAYHSVINIVDMVRIRAQSGAETYTNKIHPTQKPVKLYEWLLTNYAKPGDRILDTHLGSGSSAIAANGLWFEFVGVELDADYYSAACRRIEQAYAQPRLFEDAKVGAGGTAVQGDMLLPANFVMERQFCAITPASDV
jgi:site-specific DNA-methyltransferase (adenine-specific)